MEPNIALTDMPPQGAFQQLWMPLLQFNQEKVGNADSRTLAVLLSDPSTGAITGGLWGRTLWGSLYIDITFVPHGLRGTGIGTQLVRRAEGEALKRDCHCSWLDTYDFQAKSFYEKLGYVVFGTIEGPAPIYPRHFPKKTL